MGVQRGDQTQAGSLRRELIALKVIHFRCLILHHFKFQHSHIPTQNVIFEAGSISRLAQHICALQKGDRVASNHNAISVMTDLIDKYSVFRRHAHRQDVYPNTTSVVLTGATGSIGAHVVSELLNDDSVSTIYCLTRRASSQDAVINNLAEKDLYVDPEQIKKIVAFDSCLDKPDFGLTLEEDIISTCSTRFL
ncbi:uncharacterized protein N7446_007516 [Penicillium canescens]|uniref:Thioester reductase (TE) domain-containing protein n=1 Tax=Penicillium canescens TaxID=5083 RepID=A0AAD6NDP0_PENCN|nr:uncharacterized protein N7446_007516 [Penicillium canescens]KAJ6049157.1 hypothetical protein N7444_005873 [Penicillium canescens]KAJ6052871.1 hypothetical protein N7460_003405 [Penicillium canescens]KAJ6063396.1 hypothetical protein N7446_007516 [Penicillium canescens]KAJ6181560.1 hypothetical protein N7485_000202 [Penicillium canescens]